MVFDEELLRTRLFRENGFRRGKCPYCGHHYWTLNDKQDNCGDQPCTPYGFIGNPPGTYRPSSVADVREKFLSFFEKRGHARVGRYPVVARWRDDVYLVGASIYDFQPWVTEGIVPPPANPLTISQPSIRLTDVDKVGRSGRHLTGFEMMAHHAFNFPDKSVYWVNETVEYAHEFFTKELGIKSDEVTYKENIWEGGGNAGESFEVLVRGLEVATLVFMHYRIINGEYRDMPMKIVDTGYGLERIYWVLTGKPTVYEAVFSPFLSWARSRFGVEKPSDALMQSIATLMGQLDPEVLALDKAYEAVARKIGINAGDLVKAVKPQEALYVLADHSRTVSWMINDGVIPSNSGVGYLARLLVRRMMRYARLLGIEDPITEVFDAHLKLLLNDYPELRESSPLILELVDMEDKKYRASLKAAPQLVEKHLRSGKISVDDLINLYDSHGIPPEVVAEVASSRGVEVTVPDDFYERITKMHQRPVKEEAMKTAVPPEDVVNLPPTREEFYEDVYKSKSRARVIKVINGKWIILDSTIFYPEGGGQPADRGVIRHSGGTASVVDVQRVGPVIVHEVSGAPPREGEEVELEIDWERRLDLMRMHTGTHVLIQSIRRVLGRHVWQAGAQKDVPVSRIDVTHYKLPSPEELRRIEEIANNAVMMDMPVKPLVLPRTEAERRFGFIIYQGGVVPGKVLRILQIGEETPFDVQACGGTHLTRTGLIGPIKIIKAEKIQEGVVRFTFTTGRHAIRYIHDLESTLDEAARRLGVGREAVLQSLDKLIMELSEKETAVRRLARKAINAELNELRSREVSINGVRGAVIALEGREYAQELAKAYTSTADVLIEVLGDEVYIYTNGRIKAGELAMSIFKELGGRGGGGATYAQGRIEGLRGDAAKVEIALKHVLGELGQ
ncbi:MAG: alanine--tRNA ligase [Thermocladium sp.]|jgi:alanyl-tRNA synthetase